MSDPIGLSPRELQSRALRGVTWSSASSTIALPVAVAVSVVLARKLGPEEFARFALLSFAVPLAWAVTELGFGHAVTRQASGSFAAGELEATRRLLGKALGWNLIRLPLVLAVTLVLVRPGPLAAAALLAFLVLTFLCSGFNFALNAENRTASLAKLAFLQALAAAAASIAAALAGADAETVYVASIASGVVVLPGWVLATSPALRGGAMRPLLPRGLPAGFWRYALSALAVSLGTMLVFSRSEVVLLELFEEQQALAVFALAYGLAQRLTTPVDTLLGPLVPALAALDAAHPDRLQAGFDRALRLASIAVAFLAASAVAGMVFLAPFLFGPEYEDVGLAFAALAGISLFQSAAQPYTALVYAVGRPQIALRALGVALVVDVGVAVALIPQLGLWGAIVANAAGALAAIVLAARAVAGKGSVRLAGVGAYRLVLVTVVAAALSTGAGMLASPLHPLAATAAAVLAGTLAFVAGARLAGGLVTGGDAHVVAQALPKPLARVFGLLVRPAA